MKRLNDCRIQTGQKVRSYQICQKMHMKIVVWWALEAILHWNNDWDRRITLYSRYTEPGSLVIQMWAAEWGHRTWGASFELGRQRWWTCSVATAQGRNKKGNCSAVTALTRKTGHPPCSNFSFYSSVMQLNRAKKKICI